MTIGKQLVAFNKDIAVIHMDNGNVFIFHTHLSLFIR